jgi:hypothetical protein
MGLLLFRPSGVVHSSVAKRPGRNPQQASLEHSKDGEPFSCAWLLHHFSDGSFVKVRAQQRC